jgi:hypothetical protein
MYEWNSGVLEKQQQLSMSLVHVSLQWVIGVTWEECFCEEKSYVEHLKSVRLTVVRRDPLLRDD